MDFDGKVQYPLFKTFSKSTIHVYAIIVGVWGVVRPMWTKSIKMFFLFKVTSGNHNVMRHLQTIYCEDFPVNRNFYICLYHENQV